MGWWIDGSAPDFGRRCFGGKNMVLICVISSEFGDVVCAHVPAWVSVVSRVYVEPVMHGSTRRGW